jgi:hypothetical protein
VPERGTGREADYLDRPGKDVCERQEHQRAGLVLEQQFREESDDVPGHQGEVAVGDFAAFGFAGGARRVYQGSDVVQPCPAPVPFQLSVGDTGSGGGQAREVRGFALEVHADNVDEPVAEEFGTGQDSGHQLHLGTVLGEDAPHAGVMEDPLHLAGRGRFVDGNGDAAGKPDGEIHQRPFVGGGGHNRHGVAGFEAARDQALGKGTDILQELLRGHVKPAVGPLAPIEGVGRIDGLLLEQ